MAIPMLNAPLSAKTRTVTGNSGEILRDPGFLRFDLGQSERDFSK